MMASWNWILKERTMMIVWNAKQSSASSIQFLVTIISIVVLDVVIREASIHAFTNVFLPTSNTNFKRRYNRNSSHNSSFGHNNKMSSSKNGNREHELHEASSPLPPPIFPHRLPRERLTRHPTCHPGSVLSRYVIGDEGTGLIVVLVSSSSGGEDDDDEAK